MMSKARLEARSEGAGALVLDLEPGRAVVIGRGEGADWRLPAEPHLGRRHVQVLLEGGRLAVQRLPGAKNPVFHRGEDKSEFHLEPGDQFVIGKTRFSLVALAAPVAVQEPREATPHFQETIDGANLYAMGASSDKMRLHDLLELPEILRTKDPREFYLHVATLMRMATGGDWAVVMREDKTVLAQESGRDTGIPMTPSRKLMDQALKDSPLPTLYCWKGASGGLEATVLEGVDWAVCAAARMPDDDAILFYVAGRGSSPAAQRDSSRFVGLVADMVGRSVSVRELQGVTDRLGRYFSPPVAQAIAKSPDQLKPRVADSTVLFFDIRGFSRLTEDKNEKILDHSEGLRKAMTAMTEEIHGEAGTLLQYLGDGILACWNVPLPDARHTDRACRAALRMKARLAEVTGWECGIGIHAGEVVAGTVGSEQIFSYGVMGAVVNQASRIEGLTKHLGCPIIISGEAAAKVSPETAVPMRLGRFQPKGMKAALDLHELQPPPGDAARAKVFAEGLKMLEAGDWKRAANCFRQLDISTDGPAMYLLELVLGHKMRPPEDWDGVIVMEEK